MSRLRKYKTFKGLKRSDKTASNSEERRAFMIADLNAFVLSIQDTPNETTATCAEKLY